ncbi:RsmB/NOP family class I SAM-dependent RNA methyltransferase [Temperatibacter marinus]|uniref:RsmB/NOP family class I SAM-dependent RNA methyltransferase n=1 Tax=Temperatibacter marinus TaxID=1456591 RepID=A0AA52H8I5_9PROT|nr:RsmB/NOP family class I SAM-dependent RNA methyltransferase [Temperatibacter marinus]WND02166.1 RsmB/NOP family class I SAM-dependent RNA methyltransferase [Temperatibacter marinus]
MRPEARIAATIELLDEWLTSLKMSRQPADILVSNFFRARRYAGSKDRRAITGSFYAILRNFASLAHQWDREALTGRQLVLSYYYETDTESLDLFNIESDYAPQNLTAEEKKALEDNSGKDKDEHITLNCPEVYATAFKKRFGDDFKTEIEALNVPAMLSVRVNPLKGDRHQIFGKLVGQGIRLKRTEYSPYGFIFEEKTPLGNLDLYKTGVIEVQDEAAQIASMLIDAQEEDTVIDLCAGAGGKSLLAAAIGPKKANFIAFDIDNRRLNDLNKRAERAGVNIHAIKLPYTGTRRGSKLTPYVEKADQVIVDVPCSGTGTWRRNPDLRVRMEAEDLNRLTAQQTGLLKEGSQLVRPGGYLFYMTCSLLPQENEDIVDQFLAKNTDFTRIDARDRLNEIEPSIDLKCPYSLNEDDILLSPNSHGTDGFYISILQRLA